MTTKRFVDVAALALAFACMSSVTAQAERTDAAVTHVVEVEPGVDLHVVEWGGEGSAILFVPSWSATSHVFDTLAPKLTDSHRVLVLNKRGHGPSSRPDHGYTIDRLTQDIEVVLDRLGIQRVTLVGLSRSESLTTQFAAKYPLRVRSLIYLTGPIDRAYYTARYQDPEIASAATRRSAVERELRELCGALPAEVQPPPGSFDQAANQVGTEWRRTDPSPPYSAISAPAIAFWFLETDKEHFYARACADVDDQARAGELLKSFTRASIPVYAMQAHDIGLFEQNMRNGKVVVPRSQYYSYLSHPDLVEEQIRQFLDANPAD